MNTNFDPLRRQPKGVLAQVLTLVFSVVALGAAFMFSLVMFAIVAVAALIFGLFFWWKTRALRKQMREQMLNQSSGTPHFETASDSDVIEGEAVRVVDERSRLTD
jgi:ABC-type nickel/cobalt efflux system permease component RcnA